MINLEQAARFRRLEAAMPHLLRAFSALTAAHMYFQRAGALKTLSVSDVLDNGSIEASFQGVGVKFELLPVFGSEGQPRARIVCFHAQCTYGHPVQAQLGAFSFGEDGVTDLPTDASGNYPDMYRDNAAIVLHFLDAALRANQTIAPA